MLRVFSGYPKNPNFAIFSLFVIWALARKFFDFLKMTLWSNFFINALASAPATPPALNNNPF